MKILIVAFSESIHVTRWINQLEGSKIKVYLFPSVDNGVTNKELKDATVFHSFYGNLSYRNKNVKTKGIPVLSHLIGIVLRMILKKIRPNYHQERLRRVIKKIRPDIIHSMEIQHSSYLVSEIKNNWKGNFPKWIVTNWGSDIYLYGQLPEHREKIKKVLSSCDYYSCECQRDILLGKKHGFSKATLPVFPNSGGFNLKRLKKIREKIPPSKRRTIIVKGYQGWAGRAQVALHALDCCGKLIDGYRLVVYSIQPDTGVGIAAELLAQKYNLRLVLVPLHTSHEQILKYMSQARISIGVSISDAISTMVLEAMVMGSFPIQSNTSCANEWIKSGKTGMIVPPEDPEVIERAIRNALTNDKLVDRAALLNWKVAEKQLDHKLIKKKIIRFYNEVTNMKTNKTFVTGIFGSGKTTFVKKYAKENKIKLISFDWSFNYRIKGNQSRRILQNLPERFVMDAIPIDEQGSWDDFIEYEKKRDDVSVVCIYCPSMSVWLRRVGKRRSIIRVGKRAVYYKDFMGALKYSAKKTLRKRIIPINIEELNKDYRSFFTGTLTSLKKFKSVRYYDSCANEYTTLGEMLKRIKIDTFPFQDYLQSRPEGYDKYYQDIEIINFKGYSESYKTWNIIKDLVNWKGKDVVDLGCFQGYFSFKAEDAGANVIGLEKSETVLKTARWINKLRGGKVKLRQWEGGELIPKCDIVLCLNVLHHFPDPDKVIEMMNCKKMIFEINKKDRPIVERHLKVIKTVRSQRVKRTILLCEAKKDLKKSA